MKYFKAEFGRWCEYKEVEQDFTNELREWQKGVNIYFIKAKDRTTAFFYAQSFINRRVDSRGRLGKLRKLCEITKVETESLTELSEVAFHHCGQHH